MRFFIQLVAIVIVCCSVQYFLPWWTMAVGAFVVGYLFENKGYLSFLAGFLGAGILWLVMALAVDVATHSLLTQKVNQLLPINSFVMTSLVGGLVGGFASLSGSLLRSVFVKIEKLEN